MRWISVDDRTPTDKTGRRVWAWFEGYSDHSGIRWRRSGAHDAIYWPDECRWAPSRIADAKKFLDADELEVTHWMPLPDPPEEPEE